MKLYLLRDYRTEHVTIGRLFDPNTNFHIHTLELPWRDNQRRISCIPTGKYKCKLDFYNRGGYKAFQVMDVPDRSEIKIHIGNWTKNVLGCIATGRARMVKGDMITSSKTAFNEFMNYTKDVVGFELEILDL